jgi:hypothetical protein
VQGCQVSHALERTSVSSNAYVQGSMCVMGHYSRTHEGEFTAPCTHSNIHDTFERRVKIFFYTKLFTQTIYTNVKQNIYRTRQHVYSTPKLKMSHCPQCD